MKRLISLIAIALFSSISVSQTATSDSPATKEDVERYLDVMHSQETVKKMVAAMSEGQQQLIHEQYLKHKDELPADYESRVTKIMNDMLENVPWDQVIQGMVPIYQKHFTKNDMNALIAFYSSPTGEKLLQEMPAIMSETMQSMTPTLSKYMDTVQARIHKETDDMITQSKKKPNDPPAAK